MPLSRVTVEIDAAAEADRCRRLPADPVRNDIMSIYESDPDAAPDAAFEPGELRHLVPGNAGRALDPRRTPVTVTEVRPGTGVFRVRIEAFEDTGAIWEVPMENAGHYQFARGSMEAAAGDLAAYREAVERFDRSLSVPGDPAARTRTEARLGEERERAADWLPRRSRFLAEGGTLPRPGLREGDPRPAADLQAYLDERGVADLETAFAEQFVSNPTSGPRVLGHRIVLAELGLVPYRGKVIRDPDTFRGDWSRERRSVHILARIGFVRALFGALGLQRLALYRGLSTEAGLEPPGNHTFISATFSLEVARSHFDSGGPAATAVLARQEVPVERVFMTYHETAAMNRKFREAEAVLLFDPGNRVF